MWQVHMKHLYPTPADAKLRFNHSKRVAKLCQRLVGDMVCVDKDKMYICGIIHDMYKFLDNKTHDYMAGSWLENLVLIYDRELLPEWEKYIAAVKFHSQIPSDNESLARMILYEADKLDKLDLSYIRDSVKVSHKYETENDAIDHAIEKINRIKHRTSPRFDSIKSELLTKCLNKIKRKK